MMIICELLQVEFELADWRLRLLVDHVMVQECDRHECDFKITSINRDFEKTKQIYRNAGKPVPLRPGVHDVRPTRGLDGVPVPKQRQAVNILSIGPLIEARINELFEYPRSYKTCQWHEVAGIHFHIQVPWDNLRLPPDPRRR